ncbi:MAG TPA: hypothetical protein VLI93_08995, partial [Acetobacteraceae bacterium]|nr:hypothetical protein [Acetobacteraceae bacterium]
MSSGGNGINRFVQGRRLLAALATAGGLIWTVISPAAAQMFSDQPPPVPPASVPEPAAPAMNLAPSTGPASIPSAAPAMPQPSIAAIPPVLAPQGAAVPSQGVLSLSARYGKDLPVITSGLIWRVFSDRPDETGNFKLIREDRGATPNIVLPPGGYVVHVAFGVVSAVRAVTLKPETDRESFLLPAGGLRIEGRVGGSKIPQNQV